MSSQSNPKICTFVQVKSTFMDNEWSEWNKSSVRVVHTLSVNFPLSTKMILAEPHPPPWDHTHFMASPSTALISRPI